jgi:hypothetical protein
MKFINANKLLRKSGVWGTLQLWQPGIGTSRAVIPLKPKNGLNGAPSICCRDGENFGGLRPSFSAQVRLGEPGAPVRFL